jgi:hypothetical protein
VPERLPVLDAQKGEVERETWLVMRRMSVQQGRRVNMQLLVHSPRIYGMGNGLKKCIWS